MTVDILYQGNDSQCVLFYFLVHFFILIFVDFIGCLTVSKIRLQLNESGTIKSIQFFVFFLFQNEEVAATTNLITIHCIHLKLVDGKNFSPV